MMAGSFLWFLVGLVLLPPAVGLAGFLVPAEAQRPAGAAIVGETLRGYLLVPVIAGLLVFLAVVGVVRKVRSTRHRWSDVHVPIVVGDGGYDGLVRDLGGALASAGLPTTAADAPWVLTLPARILTRVAGGNIRKLRPDRLIELAGEDLRVGVYPSDIAISGPASLDRRARIAVLSRLAATTAHLTTSVEAQTIENLLRRVATTAAGPAGLGRSETGDAFAAVDARLLDLEGPVEEWDLLYRLRLQLERDLLVGSPPGAVFPGHVLGAATSANPAASPERADAEPAVAAAPAASRGAISSRWIATASLAAFAILTLAIGAGVAFPFDAPVLAAARTLDGLPPLWQFMSQTANFPLIAIAVLFFVWLVRATRYREAMLVVVMLAAVTAGSEVVKQLTSRPRPSGSGDGIPGVVYSYPSGHVLEVTTILGMLVIRAWRSGRPLRLRLALAAVVAVEVILVAIARLALNEHYPTDVLAGFLGALGWYAWLTRAGGWADRPSTFAVRRTATAAGPRPAAPGATGAAA